MAQLISYVENEDPRAPGILKALYGARKKPYRVGVTGPPGSGKSTLVDRFALLAREQGLKVGIVCVDPTSPFTGGAILGDRIRMSKAAADPHVFIRSMATRGSLGGIARTTEEVAEILEASGKDIVFIETVGVGQSELDIFDAVDTVVVVLVPESGAGVQAMKAGLMEIAHIFAVNKADRAGAGRVKQEIEDVLHLAPAQPWEIQVFLTQAFRGIGAPEVFARILDHRKFLEEQKRENTRVIRIQKKLKNLLLERFEKEVVKRPEIEAKLKELSNKIIEGNADPYSASEILFEETWKEKSKS